MRRLTEFVFSYFSNLNMFRKIVAAPAVIFLFLMILSGVFYVGLFQQKGAIEEIYTVRFGNFQQISAIANKVNAIHSDIFKILTWTTVGMDQDRIDKVAKDVSYGLAEIKETIAYLLENSNLNEEETLYFEEILSQLNEYGSLASDTIDVSYDLGAAAIFMMMLDDKYQELTTSLNNLWLLEKVLSEENYQFSSTSLSRIIIAFLVILLVAVVVSVAITFFAARTILAPVTKTSEIFRDIAKGDGDLTRRLEIFTRDEIGDLSRWFNEHIAHLHQIITLIRDETQKVNSYAGTMSSSVDKQASFSTQLSSSVAEISATMEEFSATAAQIASHAQTVAENAVKTLEDTREGVGCVETLTVQMREISKDNESSIQEILDLGKRSREITKIMEIINEIASQTKLIAFNAALEAASAGEAGRRFGVVAVEIRRLADSVTESTGEIEGQISSIMDSVHRLVIASEKSSKGIQEGLAFSDKTVRMLDAVVEEVEATTNAARQISHSTQQQLTATGQVVTALRNIQEGVAYTSEAVGETSTVGKSLKELSAKLETLVGKFRL